mmetsp:Transcript_69490/g.224797  ORF Transcript_69490/g.224797 Transcript_69490/m.224797 type:complete len:208 (-) Transcript_69490:425-1048(-)
MGPTRKSQRNSTCPTWSHSHRDERLSLAVSEQAVVLHKVLGCQRPEAHLDHGDGVLGVDVSESHRERLERLAVALQHCAGCQIEAHLVHRACHVASPAVGRVLDVAHLAVAEVAALVRAARCRREDPAPKTVECQLLAVDERRDACLLLHAHQRLGVGCTGCAPFGCRRPEDLGGCRGRVPRGPPQRSSRSHRRSLSRRFAEALVNT